MLVRPEDNSIGVDPCRVILAELPIAVGPFELFFSCGLAFLRECWATIMGEIGTIERCRVGGWWGGVEWGGVWWRVERGRMVWGIAGWSGKWQGCSRVDWSRVD